MVRALRDHTFALACIRPGLPAVHGRGMDLLPESLKRPLLGSLVGNLNAEELWRAFDLVLRSLTSEITTLMARWVFGCQPSWEPFLVGRVPSAVRAGHSSLRSGALDAYVARSRSQTQAASDLQPG